MTRPTDSDSPPSATSDQSITTSLLVRVKSHDPVAWQRLAYLYTPIVQRWCRVSGLQRADVEDVTQETFRAVYFSIGNFQRQTSKDTFRGWLYRIAKYKILDHWRHKGKTPQAAGGSQAARHWQCIADRLDQKTLSESSSGDWSGIFKRGLELIRGEFEERTWKAFWMLTVDERPAKDVAEELGVKVGSVYVAKSRVLKRLRQELSGLDGGAGADMVEE